MLAILFRKHRDARVRVLLLLLQHGKNLRDDGVRFSQDHIVPEPNYPIALRLDKFLALIVIDLLIDMLSTIELDHQLSFNAAEVGNVRTDRKLAPKFQIRKAPPSQPFPDRLLCVSHISAQLARVG
jgi:hypothetical protein